MTTTIDDQACGIIATEFPQYDFDAMTTGASIAHVIAVALGMDPEDIDDDDRLEQASVVLAALVSAGLIRRSDYTYAEGIGAQHV